MKTLIINGSPRKNGDTMTLIDEFQKHLQGDIKIKNTYLSSVRPCSDCRYCWEHSVCAINDEMQNVYKLIDEADNIIIASPIYFSELSGSLLQFASRLQYFWASKYKRYEAVLCEKKRSGIVILVGGGDGNAEQPLKTAKILLRLMGATFIDSMLSHNTDKIPSKDDIDALIKVREIAKQLEI